MCRMVLAAAFSAALGLSPSAAVAASSMTGSPALRHLVYSFTYGVQGNLSVHQEIGALDTTASGNAGEHDYNGSMQDKGTISVDVMREQPDTGLIVTISEQATETRKAGAATCVVYGTTNIICDPNATVNSEELTLLRFLGRNFVDPNKLDEKGHWRFDESNAASAITADYSVTPGKNGILSIQEARVVKDLGGRPATTDVTTQIVYDMNRQVPTSVQEYTVRRDTSSTTGLMKTTIQTTLSLVSDSMAKQ